MAHVVEAPPRLATKLARIAADPAASWRRFRDRLDEKIEYARPAQPHLPMADWEGRLYEQIGASRRSPYADEFWDLWPRIGEAITARGFSFGPASFYGANDGDPELARAIWSLVRHLHPRVVVETGVARGVTSRIILEAMERNGVGRLWSIDPVPVEAHMAAQIGIAVPDHLKKRWSFVPGASRMVLPSLIARLSQIDLFVHDSLHTRRNVCFETEWARKALPADGFMVIDDIDTNGGLRELMSTHPGDRFTICQSQPVRPDPRRFDGKGLFGIIRIGG